MWSVLVNEVREAGLPSKFQALLVVAMVRFNSTAPIPMQPKMGAKEARVPLAKIAASRRLGIAGCRARWRDLLPRGSRKQAKGPTRPPRRLSPGQDGAFLERLVQLFWERPAQGPDLKAATSAQTCRSFARSGWSPA